jgi:putative ABC transport system ATP-binding protein
LIVDARNLTKTYHIGASDIEALRGVSLKIDAAEFTAIVGPSGSGKTTLLNLIGLIDTPTSGTIVYNGTDTATLSLTAQRHLRFTTIGFVFQTFNLLPTLTALENVELPLAFTGRSHQAQRTTATHLLHSVGLERRLHHKPRELSIGEMQRVAIARALVNDPALIIADEPTGELDTASGAEIIALLTALCHHQRTAILVATHDRKVVEAATTQYEIRDGMLIPDPS